MITGDEKRIQICSEAQPPAILCVCGRWNKHRKGAPLLSPSGRCNSSLTFTFRSSFHNGSQVFQSAIAEAKRYKASGGDTLADMLDLLGAAEKVRALGFFYKCV